MLGFGYIYCKYDAISRRKTHVIFVEISDAYISMSVLVNDVCKNLPLLYVIYFQKVAKNYTFFGENY